MAIRSADNSGPAMRAGVLLRRLLVLGLALLLSLGAAGQDARQPQLSPAPQAAAQKAKKCDDAVDVLARVLCSKTLRVGVRTGYPPFAFEDAAGALQGFEIELAHQLAGSLGVEPVLVVVTPANRLALLGEGRVDLVIATMGHTLQRDREALFVRPHYYQSQTIVLGRKELQIGGLVKLRGNTVCVTVGNSTNAELSVNGARLKLFDKASSLVDELRLGGCSLVAQDDSFFASYLQQPAFAAAYDSKFGFAPLPWGVAVAREGGERLADVLALSMQQLHISGALQALARKHGVDSPFLAQQRKLWSSSTCAQISALNDPACVKAPLDNQLPPTSFAARVDQLEHFIYQATGTRVTLAMFKTWVALDLLLEGVWFSLLLVAGAVFATWAFALAFGAGLTSHTPWVRWSMRCVLWPMQSTPLILLMILAGAVVGAMGATSPLVALAAAVLVLGLFNGSNAGQAVAEAMLTLREERAPAQPALSAAVYRARAQMVAFVVNATRGSPAASVMGVPELLAALTDVASFSSERITTYTFLLIFYMLLVAVVHRLADVWQSRLALSGGAYA
ncbi:periplasmic component of amino acid ABC-type transporter/signal transduction system [Polaromonas sp. CF318]|uniref:transporter substrate-binding domain-containing protein n=1 Tax=Polaromonas sp. CF318 TaxID=1144318 RepID=UPI0002712627|nr:transporter substrate-binding domain-containing protein [Polaromonas sp. CF318]EJL90095.1 periplasmic component of amino acid ABC-type transporter/signal transduction system [Polaromonas sp. CF318]